MTNDLENFPHAIYIKKWATTVQRKSDVEKIESPSDDTIKTVETYSEIYTLDLDIVLVLIKKDVT